VTLRRRLLLWYTGVLFVCMGGLLTGTYLLVEHRLKADFRKFLTDEFRNCRRITLDNWDDQDDLHREIKALVAQTQYFPVTYRLYDARNDRMVIAEENRWAGRLPSRPPFDPSQEEVGYAVWQLGTNAGRQLHVLAGWLDPKAHPGLVLEVGLFYHRLDRGLDSLRNRLLGALAVTALVAAVGGHLLASRGLRPVDEIARTFENIRADDLSMRLPDRGSPDEISRIALQVNEMLDRIEASFLAVRSFTADAAHEMRTPLTTLTCRLELAASRPRTQEQYEAAIREALQQARQLAALLNDLLLLASLDAGSVIPDSSQVELVALLSELQELFSAMAEQKGLQFSADLSAAYRLPGSPGLLRRLFANLLENSIRYTPAGGRVMLAVRPAEPGCRVAVTDNGVGIPEEQIGRVFERFFRLDEAHSQGGTGLGLSIARRIAEVHGGTVEVESEVGRGSTFTVVLPNAERSR
jgi:two-component system heavy metal sensor histidine kinase CusS